MAVTILALCTVTNLSSGAWPVQQDLWVPWTDAELFPNASLSEAKGFGVSFRLLVWVCNTKCNMPTHPTLHAMGFLTCFSSQVFAGTSSVLFGTRAKPVQGMWKSGPQPKHFFVWISLSQANASLLTRTWVHASLPVYIYPWPRCCFPTANTSSPVLRTLKLKKEFFPPSHVWDVKMNSHKLGSRAKEQRPGVFECSKPACVCPYAYVLYVLWLTESYSKQLSLTFTPSANTFLNP